MSANKEVGDLLGIKPYGEALKVVTQRMLDGVGAFLGRICFPAAEEFGLLLRDKVHAYRMTNVAKIALAAEKKLGALSSQTGVHAPPRIVFNILEQGSWIDDPVVQDLWAGLLSSSCSPPGDDDSNLVFIRLLSDMTKLQARLVRLACERAKKVVAPNGLILPDFFHLDVSEIITETGENDIQRLDREVDHLRAIGLIHGGLEFGEFLRAELTPTALAIQMYVRCHGSRLSPVNFFGLEVPAPKNKQPNVAQPVAS